MLHIRVLYRLYPAIPLASEYRIAARLAEKYSCRRILDVGCGRCNLSRVLRRKRLNVLYVGMDIAVLGAPRHDPLAVAVEADASEMEVLPVFDCVFFVNSIFYIGVEVLSRYARVSKYVVIVDIDPRYPHVWLVDKLEGGIRMGRKALLNWLAGKRYEILEHGGGATYYVVVKGKA